MIQPDRYLGLETCVVRLSSLVLEFLLAQTEPIQPIKVEEYLVDIAGDDARFNFLPTLSFLFLLNMIQYDLELDIIIFNRPTPHFIGGIYNEVD